MEKQDESQVGKKVELTAEERLGKLKILAYDLSERKVDVEKQQRIVANAIGKLTEEILNKK